MTRYLSDPIGPVDPGDEAEGSGGCPGPRVGTPGRKAPGEVGCVVSTGPWGETPGAVAGGACPLRARPPEGPTTAVP